MNKFCLLLLIFWCSSLKAQVNFQDSNLPIIIVDTEGHTIVDEPKVFSTIKIINNGTGIRNAVTDTPYDFDGYAGIELRGQSSQGFDKKSYGIELRTRNNEDSAAALLGLPEEEDWVLHGPYSDKSLLRNFLTFHLWSGMGRYGSRTRLCEVVINGDYKGVYVLMEKIKRDGDRVDISKLNADENSGDDLTGGYLLKIDKINPGELIRGWNSAYSPPHKTYDDQRIFLMIEYPKPKEITNQQATYVRNYMDAFENALAGPEFDNPVTGFRAFADEQSFIDYALLTEVTRNVDGYRLSTFMYKNKDSKGGKLKMGPPWDYNLAFGNADYCDGANPQGWAWDFNRICDYDYWLIPFWWNRLAQDQEYVENFKSRWKELRAGPFKTEAVHGFIDSVALVLEEAQQRNFQRWPVLGQYIWPNNYVGSTYQNEIEYLKSWVQQRMSWMDREINDMQVILGESKTKATIVQLYPNPAGKELRVINSKMFSSYEIMDLQGKVLLNGNFPSRQSFSIDLSTLKNGTYIFKATDQSRDFKQLFIKE